MLLVVLSGDGGRSVSAFVFMKNFGTPLSPAIGITQTVNKRKMCSHLVGRKSKNMYIHSFLCEMEEPLRKLLASSPAAWRIGED